MSAPRWIVVTLVILIAVLGWLPGSFLIAYTLTKLVTGWERPEELLQGCETNLHCAEGGVYFPILGVVALLWPLAAFLALRRLSADT